RGVALRRVPPERRGLRALRRRVGWHPRAPIRRRPPALRGRREVAGLPRPARPGHRRVPPRQPRRRHPRRLRRALLLRADRRRDDARARRARRGRRPRPEPPPRRRRLRSHPAFHRLTVPEQPLSIGVVTDEIARSLPEALAIARSW